MRRYAEKRLQEENEMRDLVQQVAEGHKNSKTAKEKLQKFKQSIGMPPRLTSRVSQSSFFPDVPVVLMNFMQTSQWKKSQSKAESSFAKH